MTDTPNLRTKRFTLRPIKHEDTAALFPTFSDESNCLYLSHPPFESEDALAGWLFEPGWNGRTWIAVDTNGDVAGRFVAIPQEEPRVEEIGYVVCAHRQREGIALECAAALVAHLIEGEGARKVTAEADAENTASIRLLERLGFAKEAHFRQHETTHKGLCDVVKYGLLASEWPAAPAS